MQILCKSYYTRHTHITCQLYWYCPQFGAGAQNGFSDGTMDIFERPQNGTLDMWILFMCEGSKACTTQSLPGVRGTAKLTYITPQLQQPRMLFYKIDRFQSLFSNQQVLALKSAVGLLSTWQTIGNRLEKRTAHYCLHSTKSASDTGQCD